MIYWFRLALLVVITTQLLGCYVTRTETKSTYFDTYEYLVYTFDSDNLDSNFHFYNSDIHIQYVTNKVFDFEIKNIAKDPMYLDVGRSSLIIEDKAYNYLKTLDEQSRFYYLPDNTVFAMRSFREELTPFFNSMNSYLMRFQDPNRNYTKDNSPILLRSHLTYSFDSELKSTKRVDNQIWLKSVELVDPSGISKLKSLNNVYIKEIKHTEHRSEEIQTREFAEGRALFIALLTLAAIVMLPPLL